MGGEAWEQAREQSWDRLCTRLDEDRAVVVAVDSAPLWGTWDVPADQRGHALWVTGIESSADGGDVRIVCNDSGLEDGRHACYSREDFDAAWSARGYAMVSTEERLSYGT